ncbi:LysR family transcriptional regulator [Shewanella olleyana]|uniref:LysR family transcriptional regulator n=1 Tax=Shewanella olleyana TaxID=135626 RepID=UPI00200C0DF9|nr:LysR family transcriptional regulator [Shewanella olleyana]MCL1065784.1 LysR family transcriptional regulator [Shewanella olleyana]
MNFSLEQLQAFVTVFEEKSMSKAAIKLNKHRTTVGQVIANLEDQVAVVLFDRGARIVEPTQEGLLLYHYAKQAIEQVRTFDKVAFSLSYGELDTITIAYSSFIPHGALSLIREHLNEDFPNMRITFLVRTQQEIRSGIEDESIHFGIVNISNSNAISNLDYALLGNMPFTPYASKDSELASLPDEEIYPMLKSSRQIILKSFMDENMSQSIILSPRYDVVDQLSLAIKLVQKNQGWTLLPKNNEESGYITEHLTELNCPITRNGISVPIALWNLKTKPILEIKKSIKTAINSYINLIKPQ